MKKFLGMIAALGLLAGCTTEPESGAYQNEIRIDVVSHFWKSKLERGVALTSNMIVTMADSLDPENFEIDTLIFLNSTFDKTSSLPPHTSGRIDQGELAGEMRLFYTAAVEPEQFSCYAVNKGRYVGSIDTAHPGSFLKIVTASYASGSLQDRSEDYLYFLETTETMVPTQCGYVPGKGFFLGPYYQDPFAIELFNAAGEIVIRY